MVPAGHFFSLDILNDEAWHTETDWDILTHTETYWDIFEVAYIFNFSIALSPSPSSLGSDSKECQNRPGHVDTEQMLWQLEHPKQTGRSYSFSWHQVNAHHRTKREFHQIKVVNSELCLSAFSMFSIHTLHHLNFSCIFFVISRFTFIKLKLKFIYLV